MAKRRHTPEQVINKLREAEAAIAEGGTVAEAARRTGVTEQTFYRWRSEYGVLRIDQARRLKRLELENSRLKRAVADLTLDNQILREASEGNLWVLHVVASVSTTCRRSLGFRSDAPAGCWVILAPLSDISRVRWTMKQAPLSWYALFRALVYPRSTYCLLAPGK